MTSIIQKRLSLHKHLEKQKNQNENLTLQLSQMQALANIGLTTCMIAHEINNLLTPMASYSELALSNLQDKSLVEKALQKTMKNCRRTSEVMQAILAIANGETNKKQNISLLKLVEDVFNCLGRDFTKDGITVNIDIPNDLTIFAVPVEIQQVLMNLILNARDAMLQKGGVLNITAENFEDFVCIRVADTGHGISAENIKKIFDPFFTTKNKEKSAGQKTGNGLGLAFCKKIVDAYNGSIMVESNPGHKTIFTIHLPKAS